MAQNDNAVLTAAVGYLFTAPVGTAAPTPAQLSTIDLENPASWAAANWDGVGHTSRGDMPEFGFDGGESEVKGSWQRKKLREITPEDPVDYLTVFLHQFDDAAFTLYYGENSSNTPGVFGVKSGVSPVERAILLVIVDGEERVGFWAPKASVKRDDAIQLPIDDLAALPIRATFLDHSNANLFEWISEELFNVDETDPEYTLDLGGATGGSYTLLAGGKSTSTIAYNANAAAIKSALGAVDDGVAESEWTVTASGSDFVITGPRPVTEGTDSTTGGTGISVTAS